MSGRGIYGLCLTCSVPPASGVIVVQNGRRSSDLGWRLAARNCAAQDAHPLQIENKQPRRADILIDSFACHFHRPGQ